MDKEAWIMIMAIIAATIVILVLNGCSVVEVQVQTGSGSQNKVYDQLDRELHLMKKEQE